MNRLSVEHVETIEAFEPLPVIEAVELECEAAIPVSVTRQPAPRDIQDYFESLQEVAELDLLRYDIAHGTNRGYANEFNDRY